MMVQFSKNACIAIFLFIATSAGSATCFVAIQPRSQIRGKTCYVDSTFDERMSSVGSNAYPSNARINTALSMNLFDRFQRVAKSNLNNILKGLEDPEKIMTQALEDMQVCTYYNY